MSSTLYSYSWKSTSNKIGGKDYYPSMNELLSADPEHFRGLQGKLTKEWLVSSQGYSGTLETSCHRILFFLPSILNWMRSRPVWDLLRPIKTNTLRQNKYTSSSSWSDVVKKSLDEHDYDVAASQTVVLYNVKEGNLDNATEHETSEILNSIQISPNIVVNSSRLGKKRPDPGAKPRPIEIKLNSVYDKRLLMANAYMLKGTGVFVKPKLIWRDRQKEKALLGLRYNLINKGLERNLMRIRNLQLFYDGKLPKDQLSADELLSSLASHISFKADWLTNYMLLFNIRGMNTQDKLVDLVYLLDFYQIDIALITVILLSPLFDYYFCYRFASRTSVGFSKLTTVSQQNFWRVHLIYLVHCCILCSVQLFYAVRFRQYGRLLVSLRSSKVVLAAISNFIGQSAYFQKYSCYLKELYSIIFIHAWVRSFTHGNLASSRTKEQSCNFWITSKKFLAVNLNTSLPFILTMRRPLIRSHTLSWLKNFAVLSLMEIFAHFWYQVFSLIPWFDCSQMTLKCFSPTWISMTIFGAFILGISAMEWSQMHVRLNVCTLMAQLRFLRHNMKYWQTSLHTRIWLYTSVMIWNGISTLLLNSVKLDNVSSVWKRKYLSILRLMSSFTFTGALSSPYFYMGFLRGILMYPCLEN